MSSSVLRPNGTAANVGVSVTGSSAHAATSDDSDSTYVELIDSGDELLLNLGDLSLPAGAVLTRLVAALKCAAPCA